METKENSIIRFFSYITLDSASSARLFYVKLNSTSVKLICLFFIILVHPMTLNMEYQINFSILSRMV